MPERSVVRDDVTLRVLDVGHGPTILLLHGWPDTSDLWDLLVPQFVDAGFRCLVPDLRGCGRSSKPDETVRYKVHELVADIVAILDQCETPRAHVMGHDWGANLAWAMAAYLPERVDHLVALSLGHPTSFRSAGLEQHLRSWYTLLFFHEGVGEAFLRQNNYEAMREWLHHPRTEAIISELERDGQMSAQLRWYRANLPPESFVSPPPQLPLIQAPTLGIWSSGDAALSEQQMTNSAQFCANGFTYHRLDNAGHWLPIEAASDVGPLVIDFLRPSLTRDARDL